MMTPEKLIAESFDRYRAVDSNKLNIFLHVDEDASKAAAFDLEMRSKRGEDIGVLAGIPMAIKDNISTLGLPTTCGSKILEGYRSPYEATVVTKLCKQGAVIVGKTNMDEFAMGSSNENSAYGPVKNPLDPTRVPGGSSGGSAAAVAAGITRIALGSETGGSVRQPASFCGVVGVKPTYGRVSRYGLVAFASSLDQVGVFGKTVEDAALVMEIIAGADERDSTTADVPVPSYSSELRSDKSLKGITIGKPKEYFPDNLDPAIRALCDRALERYKSLGVTIKDVSLPHTSLAIPVYYIIAPAEASSNLARFDGVRYGKRIGGRGGQNGLQGMYEQTRSVGFGPEVTRRILLGTYVLSHGYYDAYYKKAQAVRTLITQDFTSVFDSGVDALFTPTAPSVAFKLGAVTDPYEMYMSDIFTATANLAGVPAMSLPIGRVGGMPVGGQLITRHFEEGKMFNLGFALQQALGEEAHK